jgi:hypothetical protein
MNLPGRHPDLRRLCHDPWCFKLVYAHKVTRIAAPLILHAHGNLEPKRPKEVLDQRRKGRRPKHLDAAAKTSNPGLIQQGTKFQRVIGVMMGDEDGLEVMGLNASQQKLPCRAVAAVDQIGSSPGKDQVGRTGAQETRARASLRAEEDEPVLAGRTALR